MSRVKLTAGSPLLFAHRENKRSVTQITFGGVKVKAVRVREEKQFDEMIEIIKSRLAKISAGQMLSSEPHIYFLIESKDIKNDQLDEKLSKVLHTIRAANVLVTIKYTEEFLESITFKSFAQRGNTII